MTRVEERLSELLHSAAPSLPGVELEEVERRVRHRRTVAWSAAGVAAAAAVTAGVVFVSTTDGGSSPAPVVNHSLRGAVPWIDQPAPRYQPPPPSRATPPPTDARPCRAGDVAARFLPRGDGAGGHLFIQVRFRNVSGSTCVLKGYPTRVVAYQAGLPDITALKGSFFPNQPTENIAPGHTAFLGLETDSECAARPGGGPAGPPYHHVRVSLSGGTVAVTRHEPLDLGCGLRMTAFFVPQAPPPEPQDPISNLQATLRLPRTVRAGATLEYGVELTNPTSRTISLDRCPGYVEAMSHSSGSTSGLSSNLVLKFNYALNCAPVGAIGPGDTVLFAMQVPAPKQPGEYRLDWDLFEPVLRGIWPVHNPGGPAGWGSVKVVP